MTNNQKADRKAYTERRVAKAKEYLGGKCVECGSANDLHFHHMDPSTKKAEISTAIRRECWSWVRLVDELDKCVLLCNGCHVTHHASRAEHGTARRYWRGCRCQPCRTANTEHNANYRKRRGAAL